MAFQDTRDAHSLEQMTDEEFWEYANSRAAEASTNVSSSATVVSHQYLQCEVQRGTCFVPLHLIEEVVPAPHSLTHLPFTPDWMPGLFSWRGEIVAVVNLEAYLSEREDDAFASGGVALIVRHPECIIGLRLAAVGLTTTITVEQLTPASTLSPFYIPARVDVIKGIFHGSPVLDIEALLNDVTRQLGMAARHV